MMLEKILKQHEGKNLEFKENANSSQKILATVIAFANTSGGRILIGIQDKSKQIIGIQDPLKVEESLLNMIDDAISPC